MVCSPAQYAQLQVDLDGFFAQHRDFTQNNYTFLEPVLTRKRVCGVLAELLDCPELLALIASRSYIHSQGFRKIILSDGRARNQAYRWRLHLWPEGLAQADGAPFTEMKHEHRWGFVSRVLCGGLADHWYSIRELDEGELGVFRSFEEIMAQFAPDRRMEICDGLDQFELAKVFSGIGMPSRTNLKFDALARDLRLMERDLELMASTLVKYKNERDSSGKESYQRVGPRFFALTDVLNHTAGEFRFHPIDRAHRLLFDPTQYLATSVVTGPIHEGREAGEFVRFRLPMNEPDVRERHYYTVPELIRDIQQLLTHA